MPHEPGEAKFKNKQVVFPPFKSERSVEREEVGLQKWAMLFGELH